MVTNKYLAKLHEKKQRNELKKFYTTIRDINLALYDVHLQVAPSIDLTKYEYATNYINEYISHTDIWNLKFIMNLENPEVALLQFLHLQFIFETERQDAFLPEKELVQQQYELFQLLNVYSQEHIEKRRLAMYQEIKNNLIQ